MFDLTQLFQDTTSTVIGAGVVSAIGVGGAAAVRLYRTASRTNYDLSAPSPMKPPRPKATWPQLDLAFVRAHARVLVVDNDDELVYDWLEKKGYRIQKIEHLLEGVLESLENEFDILILDVRDVSDDFDAVDGVGVLENLRARAPWIPTVMFTAWTGNIRAGRREKVTNLAQRILSKDSSIREMEDTLFDLTCKGMARDYFVQVLTRLGVMGASDVISACEVNPEAIPDWKLARTDTNASVQRECIKRVLTVANDILLRRRVNLAHVP